MNCPKRPFFSTIGRLAVVCNIFGLVLLGGAFLRDLASVGAFGISRAGDKAAVLAPLDDHHRLAALFAHSEVRGRFHALDVGHVALGMSFRFLG